MAGERIYPDEVAGPFPRPPVSFEDREGRTIEVRAYDTRDRDETGDGGTDRSAEEFEALVAMYDDFDPSDRAQGIPPGRESRIRDWLDTILGEDCLNVVAWDGEGVAGHAVLVPDEDAYELAIFVYQPYQRAGIGTNLIETLLGYGQENGVEKVWLTVERWNRPAVGLYEKVGFETSNSESFELEMSLRLTE
ncbi:GNAT family N-acetyltransferase [Halobium salinum]|uniref:GNAT family N-acetyltransferase n=1 Tax=Halobium salinum TaxID=1364940 RepID=A0ABD5PB16_9EURY|nr:GNAT family N-acetyltransferase [Halobium salinum]